MATLIQPSFQKNHIYTSQEITRWAERFVGRKLCSQGDVAVEVLTLPGCEGKLCVVFSILLFYFGDVLFKRTPNGTGEGGGSCTKKGNRKYPKVRMKLRFILHNLSFFQHIGYRLRTERKKGVFFTFSISPQHSLTIYSMPLDSGRPQNKTPWSRHWNRSRRSSAMSQARSSRSCRE